MVIHAMKGSWAGCHKAREDERAVINYITVVVYELEFGTLRSSQAPRQKGWAILRAISILHFDDRAASLAAEADL